MKRMRWNIFGIFTVLFVLFSAGPTVYELTRMHDLHPDRSFELVHNFPTDYNFYLSRIREGLEGRWTVVERYTSEPHRGSLIHESYVLMGQIGRFVRVPTNRPGDVYHIVRIVFGLVLGSAIAFFCISGFVHTTKERNFISLLAFLTAMSASSWPKLLAVLDTGIVPATLGNIASWRFGGYMSWWSVMDSLQRITFIPHLLIGQAGMLVIAVLLTRERYMKKSGSVIMIGLSAFLLGMVFPPGLVFIYTFMGVWALFHIRSRRVWILPFTAVFLLSVPSLIYLSLMTSMYPWKRLAEVDIIRPIQFDYLEYFNAVGPVFPIGMLGLILAVVAREKALLPAVTWVVSWLLLLGIFAFIPQQSPLRFSEMVPHVPLAMLTIYLMSEVRRIKFARVLWPVIPIMCVAVGLFHMYSSYLWQKDFIDHKIRATLPLVPTGSFVMYPLKDFVAAMQIISVSTPKTSVILSETTAGNYIPVLSGRTVYAGHDNTVHYEQKRTEVAVFFRGQMDPEQAKNWLRNVGITHIFFGPQEREDGGLSSLDTVYPFVTKLYENSNVILYQVQ